MGNLFNNNQPTQQTEKGNRLYEFKRVSTQELLKSRIPSYNYLA